jgi:hypothetical protein
LCPFLSFLIKSSSAFLLLFSQRKLGSDKSLAHYVAIWKNEALPLPSVYFLVSYFYMCCVFLSTVQ